MSYVKWFVAGCVFAAIAIGKAASDAGGWAALLRVGAANPHFPTITRELGPLTRADELGHDGQLYYMVARDPLGQSSTPADINAFDKNGAAYRYRRILYPLLAGGGGQFDGRATLVGMIICSVLAFGLMALAVADLGKHVQARWQTVAVAVANPGAILGLWILTADPLGLALALGGVALALRDRRGWAIAGCGAAALAKETFLVVGWGLACWHWVEGRRTIAVRFAILSSLPLIAWMTVLSVILPVAPTGTALPFDWPFSGVIVGMTGWIQHERDPLELLLALIACYTVLRAALSAAKLRTAIWAQVALPWLLLACVASARVWDKGNNAVRVFAILWPLGLLMRAAQQQQHDASHRWTMPH